MSDLPICACGEFYQAHHPECPARRAFEEALSRLDAETKARASEFELFMEERKLRHSLESRLDTALRLVRGVLYDWDAMMPDDAVARLHALAGDYQRRDVMPERQAECNHSWSASNEAEVIECIWCGARNGEVAVETSARKCGAPLSSSRTKNCLLPDGHAGDHQFSTAPE